MNPIINNLFLLTYIDKIISILNVYTMILDAHSQPIMSEPLQFDYIDNYKYVYIHMYICVKMLIPL